VSDAAPSAAQDLRIFTFALVLAPLPSVKAADGADDGSLGRERAEIHRFGWSG
jgi:hypothetical protein